MTLRLLPLPPVGQKLEQHCGNLIPRKTSYVSQIMSFTSICLCNFNQVLFNIGKTGSYKPASPGSPGGPGIPLEPLKPLIPCGPYPGNPGSPISPGRPRLPGNPGSPLSPFEPANPY